MEVHPKQADDNNMTKGEDTIEEGSITIKKFHDYLNRR